MVKYKNITIKKKGGGTRKQRVMVLASGKYRFVKNLKRKVTRHTSPRRKTKSKKRKNNPNKGGNRKMGKNTTQQLFKIIRLGALAAPGVGQFMVPQSMENKVRYAIRSYTGYDFKENAMHWDWLARGWGPYLGACLATYGIPKIAGILRKL